MVIGSVSSGKSALLNAILGEMQAYEEDKSPLQKSLEYDNSFDKNSLELKTVQGKIVRGDIAYVPQNPWLQKLTIQVRAT